MRIDVEKTTEEKYEAFSLVEMLLTIAIIGMVMLISSVTLTTLIKVSTVASNKIRARNESEFVLELVRRTVRNSDPSDVLIFASQEGRFFNPSTMEIVDDITGMETAYDVQDENETGNEIHFRPYGYKDWICLGFFQSSEDSSKGYMLRTSAENLSGQHESCFGSTPYIIVLNSDYVDTNRFEIEYTVSNDGNYLIRFEIESVPVEWYLEEESPLLKPEVIRQAVVSTEGLIW